MKKKDLVAQLRQLPDDSEIKINGNEFEVVKIIRRNSTSVELEVLPEGVALEPCLGCACEEVKEEEKEVKEELIQ